MCRAGFGARANDGATVALKYTNDYDVIGDGNRDTVIHYDNGKVVAILNNVNIDLVVNDFVGDVVSAIIEEDLPAPPDIS